jgi:hypothetical protein
MILFNPLKLILHDHKDGMHAYELDGRHGSSLHSLASELIGLYPHAYLKVVRAGDWERTLAEFSLRHAAEGSINLEQEMAQHRGRIVNS